MNERINPYSYPNVPDVSSRWDGEALFWRIGDREVADSALRDWCYRNLEHPHNYITVVRQFHINAYAQENS